MQLKKHKVRSDGAALFPTVCRLAAAHKYRPRVWTASCCRRVMVTDASTHESDPAERSPDVCSGFRVLRDVVLVWTWSGVQRRKRSSCVRFLGEQLRTHFVWTVCDTDGAETTRQVLTARPNVTAAAAGRSKCDQVTCSNLQVWRDFVK